MEKIKVNGKEYPVAMTVQAFIDISELCPGGDIQRMQELASMPTNKSMKITAGIIAALSKAAENKQHFEDPEYKPDPIKIEGIMALSIQEYTKIMEETFRVIGKEMTKQTVELEPPKKNGEEGKK